MTSIIEKFVEREIDKALRRRGLPWDSRVRSDLQARAEIGGGRDAIVNVCDESNCVMTLDQRIQQLKHDPNYCDCFAAEPPRVSRKDEEKLRENFSKIASGAVIVE
jgi:hypothetical protein